MKLNIYNIKAEKVREAELAPNVFEVPVKEEVVRQALIAQMANNRNILAHTKGRANVRGGGKKPWKQKGTGRARHGSIRSPLWIGGGVTFGPTNERNFAVKINKKVKKKALNMALSDKALNGKIVLLDALKLEEARTKKMKEMLNNFKNIMDDKDGKEVENGKKGKIQLGVKKILMLYTNKAENLIKASRNIEKLKVIGANNLNIRDLLEYEYVIMEEAGLEVIEKLYSVNREIKKLRN
ncbi:MAG: 50S ribosomal protein L4 [bacterium]